MTYIIVTFNVCKHGVLYIWNLSIILIYLVRIYKTGNTDSVKIIRHQPNYKTSEAGTEVHMALKAGQNDTEKVSTAIRTRRWTICKTKLTLPGLSDLMTTGRFKFSNCISCKRPVTQCRKTSHS